MPFAAPKTNRRRHAAPRGVADRFVEQLGAALDGIAPRLIAQRDWASATFTGLRLTVALDGAGEESSAEEISARLVDHPFALPGHFVADIAPDAEAGEEQALAVLILKEA